MQSANPSLTLSLRLCGIAGSSQQTPLSRFQSAAWFLPHLVPHSRPVALVCLPLVLTCTQYISQLSLAPPVATMGLKHTDFFENTSYEASDTQIIVCNECLSHLCLSSLVLSDKFWGLSGDAFLVDKLINVQPDHKDQETPMKTGIYLINKIRCQQCFTSLGWLYKKLFKYSESYKEGKYVIEKKYIRQIPNHSATAALIQQAKLLRRRRSSTSTLCSSSLEEDTMYFPGTKKDLAPIAHNSVLSFREGISQALSRQRFLGIDKDEFDEHDEDDNVFVDA